MLSRIDPGCSTELTRRPGWAGDDNALPTYGLRTKVRRVGWATLTKHKWVISGERRCLRAIPQPRRAAKLTHLCPAKLAHPGHIAAAAKTQQGKALSSPPTAGGWVTFGVHTRTNSRARRRPAVDNSRPQDTSFRYRDDLVASLPTQ